MSQVLEVHFNIILPSKPGLPSGLFPSGFPTKNLYAPLLSPIRATYPANLILLYLIYQNYLFRSTEHQAPRYVVFCTPCYLIRLKSRYLPQHPILKNFDLCCSLNVRDLILQPHKITGKILVLFI